MPKRATTTSSLSAYEKQRRDRIAWCQANVSIDDDVKRYWNKAKDAYKAVSDWWSGSGDYEIVSNSLIHGGTKAAMQPLVVSNQRHGGEVRIRFREYLGDVKTHPTTVGAWFNKSYTLNPGNDTTFPWFNAIANQYEQWTPNGIIFEFRSTATEYSTTANLGSVVMATDYDYADDDYGSKMEALNSAYAAESKISTEIQYHGIECAPQSNPTRIFYVNPLTTVPSGTSKHEYFLGKFQIATVGSAAAADSVVGSLYVNYEITLRKPQYVQGFLGKDILFDLYNLRGNISHTNPLGDTAPVRSGDSTLLTTIALNTVTFPAKITSGLFRVTWGGRYTAGGSNSSMIGPGLTLTNCVEVSPPDGLSYWQTFKNAYWGIAASRANDYSGTMLVKVTNVGASIQFTTAGSAGFLFDSNSGFLFIEQVNSTEA